MQNTARYEAIDEHLSRGQMELCPSDYHFYRRYCKQNDISPLPFAQDGSVPSISYDDNGKYECIMHRLDMGRPIGSADYRYLKRYCLKRGLPFPRLESRIQFWLKK